MCRGIGPGVNARSGRRSHSRKRENASWTSGPKERREFCQTGILHSRPGGVPRGTRIRPGIHARSNAPPQTNRPLTTNARSNPRTQTNGFTGAFMPSVHLNQFAALRRRAPRGLGQFDGPQAADRLGGDLILTANRADEVLVDVLARRQSV